MPHVNITIAIAFQSQRPSFMVKVNEYNLRVRLRNEKGVLLPHTGTVLLNVILFVMTFQPFKA